MAVIPQSTTRPPQGASQLSQLLDGLASELAAVCADRGTADRYSIRVPSEFGIGHFVVVRQISSRRWLDPHGLRQEFR